LTAGIVGQGEIGGGQGIGFGSFQKVLPPPIVLSDWSKRLLVLKNILTAWRFGKMGSSFEEQTGKARSIIHPIIRVTAVSDEPERTDLRHRIAEVVK